MGITLKDILERAHSGPVCTPHDWDLKVLPGAIRNKLKKYKLEKTFDSDNPICSDDSLIQEYYKAGWELALEMGYLCVDTNRIIKFTEEELREAINGAPSSLTLGEGADAVVCRARKPEDPIKPVTAYGPFGNPVSEDMWLPIHMACAQCRVNDVLFTGTVATVFGLEVRADTPLETAAGLIEPKVTKEAARMAGRPGMPIVGVSTSPTEYGFLGGYAAPEGYGATDIAPITTVECKISYQLLHKIVRRYLTTGAYSPANGGAVTVIGGISGPPEGAALLGIAGFLMMVPLACTASLVCGGTIDAKTGSDTSRKAVWVDTVYGAAVSKNTHVLRAAPSNPVHGPLTDEHLYESAVKALSDPAAGASFCFGVKSAQSKGINYCSPLEWKLSAEIVKGSAGMKRTDANEIVKKLIPKYEEKLLYPDMGKPFVEVYDVKTLKIKPEAKELYERIRKELEGLGVMFA